MTQSKLALYLTVLLTIVYTVGAMAVPLRQQSVVMNRANRLRRTEASYNSTIVANNNQQTPVSRSKKLKVSPSTTTQTISPPANATNNQPSGSDNSLLPRYNYTVYYPIVSSNDTNNNNFSAPINEILEIHDHVIDQRPRQVTSINGTIDASQYNNADLDRLYNDALLVYFKNFNDNMPANRPAIQYQKSPDNSTSTPVYRSDRTSREASRG